jgi:hypothetical protein
MVKVAWVSCVKMVKVCVCVCERVKPSKAAPRTENGYRILNSVFTLKTSQVSETRFRQQASGQSFVKWTEIATSRLAEEDSDPLRPTRHMKAYSNITCSLRNRR